MAAGRADDDRTEVRRCLDLGIFLYIWCFPLKTSFVRNLDNMARTHDLLLMLIDRAWHSVRPPT